MPRSFHTAALALFPVLVSAPAFAQGAPRTLTDAEKEHFLRTAQIIRVEPIGSGITKPLRATLSDGVLTHDAQIQTVNHVKRVVRSRRGYERDFRDSWRYNVAAYHLDRLLGLDLVPVTVERTWHGKPAAFTWWVDEVMMDERTRQTDRIPAPPESCWVEQTQRLRLLDQLIENTDRHAGNILIAQAWRVWAIDHTRAFRRSSRPENPASVVVVDPAVLDRLAGVDRRDVERAVGRYLEAPEIEALLSRRDALVAHLRTLTATPPAERRCLSAGA